MANSVTLTMNQQQYETMKNFYSTAIVQENVGYIKFMAKIEKCTILFYTSMKVLFQGENAEYEASIWSKPIETKKWKYDDTQIGSDEVGTGDYFGPIIVVAAYVKNSDIRRLNELGIGDSKKISDEKILQIVPELLKIIPYSQLCLDNIKFNEMTKKGYNMNKIKAVLHNHALLNLKKKIKLAKVLTIVDQFTPQKNYFSYLKDVTDVEKNIEFTTKAESLAPSVATASMIARYSFLKKWQQMEETYHFIFQKGASSLVDEQGAYFVQQYGEKELEKVAKVNFKNTDKIKGLLNNLTNEN